MKDLITVIINVYNDEKHIKKCIESIVNQTYKNLEIIIVNDGSVDNTLSICESFDDKRIIIINQKNMGLSLSRNVGIDNSHGKYLYFIDSDDYVDNDFIEYLYNLIKKYNVSMSTCTPLDIYNYNFKFKQKKEIVKVISDKEMLSKILLLEKRSGTTWNKLMKKELFNNIRFEKRIINDVVTTHKLVIEAKKIAYSNQIKYYYLKHQDSILGRKNENHSIDLYKAVLERYDFLKEKYPDFIQNEIGVLLIILILYVDEKENLQKFLKKENVLQEYNKLFSFKILF